MFEFKWCCLDGAKCEGVFIYFEDNAGVIVNPKGEMKGYGRHLNAVDTFAGV